MNSCRAICRTGLLLGWILLLSGCAPDREEFPADSNFAGYEFDPTELGYDSFEDPFGDGYGFGDPFGDSLMERYGAVGDDEPLEASDPDTDPDGPAVVMEEPPIAEPYLEPPEIPVLRENALLGDARAQFELGRYYGSRGNWQEAGKWYWQAAEDGHAEAQHRMGVRFLFGQGQPENHEEAIKWFARAAEQGHAPAQYSLGLRYLRGEGVDQDFKQAARWFEAAAAQGLPEAQISLARRYAPGEGVPQDLAAAFKWLDLAAAHDESRATQERERLLQILAPE